jgi:hypothetical protein
VVRRRAPPLKPGSIKTLVGIKARLPVLIFGVGAEMSVRLAKERAFRILLGFHEFPDEELVGVADKMQVAFFEEALRLLDREGLDTILADRGTRHRTRQIELDGLLILHSRPAGEQLLDIWEGPKVFSVAWDATGFLTVIAFRLGAWRTIAGSDAA